MRSGYSLDDTSNPGAWPMPLESNRVLGGTALRRREFVRYQRTEQIPEDPLFVVFSGRDSERCEARMR